MASTILYIKILFFVTLLSCLGLFNTVVGQIASAPGILNAIEKLGMAQEQHANFEELRESGGFDGENLMGDIMTKLQLALKHRDIYSLFPDSIGTGSAGSSQQSDCANQLLYLMEALAGARKDSGAFAFIDATGKLHSGLMTGALTWMGTFSQCLNISLHANVNTTAKGASENTINGQYCYVSIGEGSGPVEGMSGGLMFSLGLCLPATCSRNSTATFLNEVVHMVSDKYNVRGLICQQSGAEKLDKGAVAVIVLLSILGAVIVMATAYDYFTSLSQPTGESNVPVIHTMELSSPEGSPQSTIPTTLGVSEYTPLLGSQPEPQLQYKDRIQSMCTRLLLCFSIMANGSKVLSTRPTSQKNLSAVHGIRFISMTWVILGHSIFVFIGTIKNPLVLFTDFFKRYSFMAITSASVSVDTFFLLSGTLASYLLLTKLREKAGHKNINWALVYFHRFWRLTPPYMLIIAVYTTLYHYMGSGPLYPQAADALCQKNWWKNLLYINNFFAMNDSCINWTWYLANDMQFFIITPLIVVLLFKWAVLGGVLILALLLTNIIFVGVVTKENNYPADLSGVTAGTDTLFEWMDKVYVRPYARVGVYMVGVTLGYILYRTGLKPKLHWAVVILGWVVAFVCCFEVIYGLHDVIDGQKELSANVNAFYASVYREVWAVGVAWVIFACATGYGGPVNTFLSWVAMVPLSRLTYMAYLVHPIVLFYVNQSMEQTVIFNEIFIMYNFIGGLVISYGIAFVTSMAFEAPMMALEKVVFPQQ